MIQLCNATYSIHPKSYRKNSRFNHERGYTKGLANNFRDPVSNNNTNNATKVPPPLCSCSVPQQGYNGSSCSPPWSRLWKRWAGIGRTHFVRLLQEAATITLGYVLQLVLLYIHGLICDCHSVHLSTIYTCKHPKNNLPQLFFSSNAGRYATRIVINKGPWHDRAYAYLASCHFLDRDTVWLGPWIFAIKLRFVCVFNLSLSVAMRCGVDRSFCLGGLDSKS